MMNTLEAIFSRKSVREFSEQAISEQDLHIILKAGMSGPSCVNARDWAFLVVDDKEKLIAMANANGRPAEPLKGCALGIMVLGDYEKAFDGGKDYWIIDGAIAAQNMILAAQSMGIGSVWLGTYPQMGRVDRQKELFEIPEHLIPHSIIAFGYPQNEELGGVDRVVYEQDKVFFNGFENKSK